jgi:4-amino-4-deoxy-L-arabinose transferase-like glycosyltransferase
MPKPGPFSRLVTARPYLALTMLALFCLLPGLADMPLMDRDEPRFARATVEMLERADMVIPWFNGDYRFDKPPLTYWWMMPHFRIFGICEFAARLHSVISAWLVALCLASFARRMKIGGYGPFLAGAGWLTSLQVLFHGRMALADMPMVLCVVLSMRAAYELLQEEEPGRKWWWLLWLSAGVGFLAKGPLALAVPMLALLLLRFAFRRGEPLAWKRLGIALGLPLAFGIVAAWGIPALLRTHGLFYQEGINKHVVDRGLSAMNSRDSHWWFYFAFAPVFLVPWTGWIPAALRQAWRGRSFDGRFLLAWLAAPFVIFSLYATQLPHYVLPGYPAFFLLVAAAWQADRERPPSRLVVDKVFAWLGIVIAGALVLGTLAGLKMVPSDVMEMAGLRQGVLWMGVFAALLLAAAISNLMRKPLAAVGFVALGVLCWLPAMRGLRSVHASILAGRELSPALPGRYTAINYGEPSLVWYGARKWQFLGDTWKAGDPPRTKAPANIVLLRRWRLDDKTFPAIWRGHREIQPKTDLRAEFAPELLATAHIIRGWSPATGAWVELAVFPDLPPLAEETGAVK